MPESNPPHNLNDCFSPVNSVALNILGALLSLIGLSVIFIVPPHPLPDFSNRRKNRLSGQLFQHEQLAAHDNQRTRDTNAHTALNACLCLAFVSLSCASNYSAIYKVCVSLFCEALTLSLPSLGFSWISAAVYAPKNMLESPCFLKTVISVSFSLSFISFCTSIP